MKLIYAIVLLMSLLLLTGCEFADKINNKVAELKNGIDKQNNMSDQFYCPEIDCPACPDTLSADAIVYYNGHQQSVDGFKFYLENSKGKLYCAFQGLENQEIAELLVAKDANILIGRDNTLDQNSVPYAVSSYNYLYSNALMISVKPNIHYTFCADDSKVFMSTKFFNADESQADISYIFKGQQFVDMFKLNFDEINGRSA